MNQPPPPILIQQLLWAQATMPPMPHIHSSHGPPYQDMGQRQYQHRPNSGPMRHQHHGSLRMTEAPTPYHLLHESSSTIASDHATGTHPVNAQMGADNSGTGQKRKKPYHRHRLDAPQTHKQRRGKEDLSGYEIPIMASGAGVPAGGSNTPAVIPVPAPAPPIASTSAATPPMADTRRRGRGGNTKTKVRRRPVLVYDDDSDVHRVSSGSETN
ncbi:hypothetical protein BYT27DRAFT_7179682 [Phlegmacium glaucopus]|nr:hypothetical protein BYT27DRAFT_7179682 [Phlegmacium glaucopus]